jgi:hypothetical protein
MTPQRSPARCIRLWPLTTRKALGCIWRVFINPGQVKGHPVRQKPTLANRRAALVRLARLTDPNSQQIARELLP